MKRALLSMVCIIATHFAVVAEAQPLEPCTVTLPTASGASTSVALAPGSPLHLQFDEPVRSVAIVGDPDAIHLGHKGDLVSVFLPPDRPVANEATVALLVELSDGYRVSVTLLLTNQRTLANTYRCFSRRPTGPARVTAAASSSGVVPGWDSHTLTEARYCYNVVSLATRTGGGGCFEELSQCQANQRASEQVPAQVVSRCFDHGQTAPGLQPFWRRLSQVWR